MALRKETIYVGVIGLLAGVIIAGGAAVLAVNNNNQSMMRMMGMDTSRMKDDSSGHMGMSMDDMQSTLEGKAGDDFDKNFVAMMIAHHQGAVDMAKLAGKNAKHQEVKDLSEDILSAQSNEIDMMKAWQADWGYKTNSQSHMMDH
jgi:uncharacterized protein (DUF305 family)